MSQSQIHSLLSSTFSRVFVLGALILILQIPIAAIRGLIFERSQTERQAVNDIAGVWGGPQLISGPVLSIPYKPILQPGGQSGAPVRAYFIAKNVEITGDVKTEERYRGIFRVPVYTAVLHISGTFDTPSFSEFNIAEQDALWDQAAVTIGMREPEKLQQKALFQWDGAPQEVKTGLLNEKIGAGTDALHIFPLSLQPGQGSHRFEMTLTINGSSQLDLLPLAAESKVSLSSPWPHPGFVGSSLPTTREVTEKGFHAEWKSITATNWHPVGLNGQTTVIPSKADKGFGVTFVSPVDTYRMNERLIKYQLFIIFLTFLTFYIFEIFYNLRIHPVQYLLIGAALCLFYLLTLSFSEHLGFAAAYAIASCCAVSLVWFYSSYMLRGGARGSVLGALLGSLYAYFYVVLQQEDYALLLGSIGLTLILAVVMYITRNINWYKISDAPVEAV